MDNVKTIRKCKLSNCQFWHGREFANGCVSLHTLYDNDNDCPFYKEDKRNYKEIKRNGF